MDSLFAVDLLDEDGEMKIPVRDRKHLKYDIVGSHLARYDFMINLAHFKGHPMGGLGGALKNASIGVASANGKAYIHTAGYQEKVEGLWDHVSDHDGFLESMAAAAQAVDDYFGGNTLYIKVMNNMTVDCDCVARRGNTCVDRSGGARPGLCRHYFQYKAVGRQRQQAADRENKEPSRYAYDRPCGENRTRKQAVYDY